MPDITAAELKTFRHGLDLSAEAFAHLTGTREGRTVRRWEAGDQDVPGPVQRLVRCLMLLPDDVRRDMVALLMAMPPPDPPKPKPPAA